MGESQLVPQPSFCALQRHSAASTTDRERHLKGGGEREKRKNEKKFSSCFPSSRNVDKGAVAGNGTHADLRRASMALGNEGPAVAKP